MVSELHEFFNSVDLIVFLIFGIFAVLFCIRWYRPLIKTPQIAGDSYSRVILILLPLVLFIIMYTVLSNYASFDVVDSVIYKTFYIVLGYAWLYFGLVLMSVLFGLIYPDDAVHLNNKAALIAITGEMLALTAIYAGANIGDGPGWWCVFFAGGLGLAAWIILGLVYHFFTGIFERITVDRDLGSAVRFFIYLVLSGIILGYACSGDWTSFLKTLEEFLAGWTVLPLTLVMILLELFFQRSEKHEGNL